MTQEVLKLALECAERCEAIDGMYSWTNTITAIKEALREHAMREVQRLGQEIEQEPVKYSDYEPDGVHHNKPAQPEQEPVAYINVEKRRLEFAEPMVWHTPTVVKLERIPLYTHQRTWVDLTDEEIDNINYTSAHMLAREVLAKIKQKNGYAEEKNNA